MQLETARSEKKRKKMKEEREKKEEEERMKMEEKLEMDEKKQTIGIWMSKYRLPREMKKQIMQNIIPRLERKKDVCVENLFYYLPEDISNAVKRYLCLDLLKKVSSNNLIPSSQLSLSLSLFLSIYIFSFFILVAIRCTIFCPQLWLDSRNNS